MRSIILAAALALSAAACGGSNPAAPTQTVLGTYGAILDAGCATAASNKRVTSAVISIDGVVVRTITPGESATKQVPLGTHTLTIQANNPAVGYTPDTRVLTGSQPDFILRIVCI